MVFSPHDLATDGSFGEMHLILCRNVLIYFSQKLKERAFNLFYDSLVPGGFLCLGASETLENSAISSRFEIADKNWRIYRRKS